MKPILLVRADSMETFGVAPAAFAEATVATIAWDALNGGARPPLADFSGVVVFGSTYNVEHADEQPFIKELRELTREALDRDTPYLGVCFGSQVLAWTLDKPVLKAPAREVGFEPLRPLAAAAADPLLSHFADGDMVFEWHMDTFELPDGAELLATGDLVPNQAYRVGELAWGMQFHFEVDAAEIESWLQEVANVDLAAEWGKSHDEIRDEARRYAADHEERGREVFRRFADVARERTG